MAKYKLPGDLSALSDADIEVHLSQATEAFDSLTDSEGPIDLNEYEGLATGIEGLRTLQVQRAEEQEAARVRAEEIRLRVHPTEEPAPEAEPEPEAVTASTATMAVITTPNIATTPSITVTPRSPGGVGSATRALVTGELAPAPRRLNPPISEVQRNAPAVLAPPRQNAVLVASSDIPGVPHASQLNDIDALVAAMQSKARTLPVTNRGLNSQWYPVAAMQNEFRYNLDINADPKDINAVLKAATDEEALVAAGGWCAPSEISYDFYNIVCEDGMVDLPTVGVQRGGIRWPTSPTFAEVLNGADNFWTWTETQDVAAVTGTEQSGSKVCARVPCPDFNEERLHCDGLCLTVGNLTEYAYPELIANHLRLLFASHAKRINGLKLIALENSSTAVTLGVTGLGATAQILGAIELQAIDYRERFGMCNNAVLEVILPRWVIGVIRSDLRKRTGVDLVQVTDERIRNFFDVINVRVQWVGDWQVRESGFPGWGSSFLTEWPTQVKFMLYSAGTFLLGRGLQLNLGVIRDSVLNATNDHTGAWMEECWLIAKIGHESRVATVNYWSDGTTGAADITAHSL